MSKADKNPEVRKICRLCGKTKLVPILNLGRQAVSTFVASPLSPVKKAPLTLAVCNPENSGCGLVQLYHAGVPQESLYRQYWYKSGVNRTMTAALHDIARTAQKLLNMRSGDYILDIGANDGTLLRSFKLTGLVKIGYEPARNLTAEAQAGGNIIINDYFGAASWRKNFPGSQVKLITTIAMFYDLEDPNTFCRDLKKVLTADGMWINQMTDLLSMIKYTMFDNICHEHLTYYSLQTLSKLLARHDLKVVDVTANSVNGGSLRTFITHAANRKYDRIPGADDRIRQQLARENNIKFDNLDKFAQSAQSNKKIISRFISQEKTAGKSVWGYGASTKGNTTLQYLGLDSQLITAIAERNPAKWGRYTAGSRIPIRSETEMRSARPDYLLVLPWHFRQEFISREAAYLHSGGTLIFPLPTPQLIYIEDGKLKSKRLLAAGAKPTAVTHKLIQRGRR